LKKVLLFFKVKILKIKNLLIFMLCNALSHRHYWNQACLVGSESNRPLFKYCRQPQALNYTFNPPTSLFTFAEDVAMPNIDDQELHLIAS
jgi:hypothetical protein